MYEGIQHLSFEYNHNKWQFVNVCEAIHSENWMCGMFDNLTTHNFRNPHTVLASSQFEKISTHVSELSFFLKSVSAVWRFANWQLYDGEGDGCGDRWWWWLWYLVMIMMMLNGGAGMLSKCSRRAIILAFIVVSKAFLHHLALIVFLKECVHTCLCSYILHNS